MINYLSLNGLSTLVSQIKSYFVPQTRTVNGKALSSDIEIDASDISLLVDGKIPSEYLPSYVDDVLEYDGEASFPETGEAGKIYVDTSTNKTYRWSGSTYVEITAQDYELPAATSTTLGGVMVDSALSSTSTNPVQNNVINSRLESIDSDIADLQDEINTLSDSSIESYVSDINDTPKRSTSSLIYTVSHTNTSTGVSTGTSLTIPEATSDYAGLMTAADKTKLDSLSEGSGTSELTEITTDEITALFAD